jgi:hypothetical protein
VALLREHRLRRHVAPTDLPAADGRLVVTSEAAHESVGQLALAGQSLLDRRPVPVEQLRGVRGASLQDRGDLDQWHVEAAQQRDQAGGVELALVIATVAVAGLDLGRPEQTDAVVESQRLDRQPGPVGKLAAAEQLAGHRQRLVKRSGTPRRTPRHPRPRP